MVNKPIETESGREIITLSLSEYIDKECGIIGMLLENHKIYAAQGRIKDMINEYERIW